MLLERIAAGLTVRKPKRLLLDGGGRCFDLSVFHKDRMIKHDFPFQFAKLIGSLR